MALALQAKIFGLSASSASMQLGWVISKSPGYLTASCCQKYDPTSGEIQLVIAQTNGNALIPALAEEPRSSPIPSESFGPSAPIPHAYEPLAGTLKSLQSMDISILVRVVCELIFIILFSWQQ